MKRSLVTQRFLSSIAECSPYGRATLKAAKTSKRVEKSLECMVEDENEFLMLSRWNQDAL